MAKDEQDQAVVEAELTDDQVLAWPICEQCRNHYPAHLIRMYEVELSDKRTFRVVACPVCVRQQQKNGVIYRGDGEPVTDAELREAQDAGERHLAARRAKRDERLKAERELRGDRGGR